MYDLAILTGEHLAGIFFPGAKQGFQRVIKPNEVEDQMHMITILVNVDNNEMKEMSVLKHDRIYDTIRRSIDHMDISIMIGDEKVNEDETFGYIEDGAQLTIKTLDIMQIFNHEFMVAPQGLSRIDGKVLATILEYIKFVPNNERHHRSSLIYDRWRQQHEPLPRSIEDIADLFKEKYKSVIREIYNYIPLSQAITYDVKKSHFKLPLMKFMNKNEFTITADSTGLDSEEFTSITVNKDKDTMNLLAGLGVFLIREFEQKHMTDDWTKVIE